jgi:mannose-6-phosphate isomerase-like protein (cupin superfamily)
MNSIAGKSFANPDETTEFPNGVNQIVSVNGFTMSRSVFQPGWRWSNDLKPIVKTESCQEHHRGYVVSGRLGIRMNDGSELELGPESVVDIAPGHDGWVIGNEPLVMIEVGGENYGKPKA